MVSSPIAEQPKEGTEKPVEPQAQPHHHHEDDDEDCTTPRTCCR